MSATIGVIVAAAAPAGENSGGWRYAVGERNGPAPPTRMGLGQAVPPFPTVSEVGVRLLEPFGL